MKLINALLCFSLLTASCQLFCSAPAQSNINQNGQTDQSTPKTIRKKSPTCEDLFIGCATCLGFSAVAAFIALSSTQIYSMVQTNKEISNQCEVQAHTISDWQSELPMLKSYNYTQLFTRTPQDRNSQSFLEALVDSRQWCSSLLARELNFDTLHIKKFSSPAGPQLQTMDEQDAQCQLLDQLEQQVIGDHNKAMALVKIFPTHCPLPYDNPLTLTHNKNLKTINAFRTKSGCPNMPIQDVVCLLAKQMKHQAKVYQQALVKYGIMNTSESLLTQRVHAAKLRNIKAIQEKNNCIEEEDNKTIQAQKKCSLLQQRKTPYKAFQQQSKNSLAQIAAEKEKRDYKEDKKKN